MKRQQYNWQLPPAIEQRLGENTYGRPRAIYEDGQLLLILQEPPGSGAGEPKHQVFLRRADGKFLGNGEDFGDARLRSLLALYQKASHEADEAYGRAATAEDLFRLLERLGPLARAAANLHSALQAARAAVGDDALLIAARDEAYDRSHELELLLGDARLALDYRMAHEAEAQAARMREMAKAQHKLNILAAVTFPLMAVSLLANLSHGLGGQGQSAFWLVVTLALAVGAVTVAWVVLPGRRAAGARQGNKDGRPRRR